MSEVNPELMDSVCQFRLEETTSPKYPAQSKDSRAVKNNLIIEVSGHRTSIVIIALSTNPEANVLKKIRCEGTPLSGYVYNVIEDCYYVRCAGHIDLEVIPIAYCMKARDNSFWMEFVPMPDSIVKKYMNEDQLAVVKSFKNNYRGEEYTFEYIQFVE